MKRYNVIITDFLKPPANVEQTVLGETVDIHLLQKTDESELGEFLDDAKAMMVWHKISITKKTIERLKKCKIIVRCGVGYDNIDTVYAGENGIAVCNVPDYGTNDVADHTLALLLSLVRGLEAYNNSVKADHAGWYWHAAGILHRLTNRTMGIIGLGRIGTAVALRAKAFGIKIIFYDPYIPDGIDKALGFERVEFIDLIQRSDIISFHTPLTDETRNMANALFFSRIKPGLILINTARGEIIDFVALKDALMKNDVSLVGLDVLPCEPPDANNDLFQAWQRNETWIKYRMIITPHCAFYNEQAFHELREKAAREIARVLNNELPRNCINKQYLI